MGLASQIRATSPRRTARRGFTLFEIVLVTLILGICAGTFLAAAGGDLRSSRLSVAANVLASDIEFTQGECINQPSDPCKMVFDTVGNTYSVIDTTTGNVIPHPADSMPFTNDFATGRNAQLAGVSVTSVMMGTSPMTVLQFDAYGRPLVTTDLSVLLSYNGSTMHVNVKAGTGDVSIVSP
jgi:prepilin-type N-terminal cleavage/methylation domain-containing protein